ncbi:hypothetical protein EDC14_1007142 [Hydrogenispora ethanolica]|jgi:hypothetical protein|uniref:Uncharacterized protein n=1 Tax=Hydrogenispora ethanolica TaxID=1082276 RepID=A0A4R1RY46_HYDET|nr:hypothetical protein [Hydrogenispora ethanolica]TCL71678.1 hypothetical protein EDC14_1007142 [Hydrogenispora ethanolica]
MNSANRSIQESAEAWVTAMLELLRIMARSGQRVPAPDPVDRDLRQFEALADHLQMLLSIRPANSWEGYHWSLNFAYFLSQLIRDSEHLFQHLAADPESRHFPIAPALVADIFRCVRLANRLPNLY